MPGVGPYIPRHNGGIRIVFVDGHVQRFRYEQARPGNYLWNFGTPEMEYWEFQYWGWLQCRGYYPEWPDIPSF
jgi:prepilin-type processing-associated H-X9-DG protein